MAAELLPGEGFTEVQYIRTGQELFAQAMAAGEIDIALNFSGPLLPRLEAGDPLVILAGAVGDQPPPDLAGSGLRESLVPPVISGRQLAQPPE